MVGGEDKLSDVDESGSSLWARNVESEERKRNLDFHSYKGNVVSTPKFVIGTLPARAHFSMLLLHGGVSITIWGMPITLAHPPLS